MQTQSLAWPFGFLSWLLLCLTATVGAADETKPMGLRTDFRQTPLGVDLPDPRLSWRLEGERPGLAQLAFQIQVASDPNGFERPNFWDSGWVQDAQSAAILYECKAFAAKQRIYWRVRIEDDRGEIGPWSEPTWFEAGLLEDTDWNGADWISCSRRLQTEYGPPNVMGDWISAREEGAPAETITYKFAFPLPEKHVVYAGAWWSHVEQGEINVLVNGLKGLNGTEGPPTIYYKDFGFYMQRENEVRISLSGADLSTPVCFGMRIVFADGSEKIIGTSERWSVVHGGEEKSVRVACDYGKEPLGRAKVSPRAPLEAAWYKMDFEINKKVASARLYICGLGYNEPYLNGVKVGDHVLDPGQTDYETFAHYAVFDAGDQIEQGTNALAVLLGDGWYNNDRWFSNPRRLYGKPGLRAYLDIRYEDGTCDQVVTNRHWHWKPAGITMSNLFLGDHVDFRKWHAEWESPGTPLGWRPVRKVKPLSPKLVAQDFPPVRVVREIEPVKTWQVGEKTWIVDLGENISGWVGLDIEEPAGTEIRLRLTEMLDPSGKYLDNVPESFWSCHSSPQHHWIIADGRPRTWRPYFSYHGFRFAEIHGLSKPPTAEQIRGMVVNTDCPVTASFKSSDPLLDRIFQMGVRGHLSNMHSVLEDCPHREKCLWGGDLHSSWATGFHTLDSASFYRQQVRLFYTRPFDPRGIPGRVGVGRRATNSTLDFTWSVSPLFIAWRNYRQNGDLQTPEEFYDLMRSFLSYFEKESPDLIPVIHRYGDHAPPIGVPRTPADSQLIAAINYFAAAERFSQFAEALGRDDDVRWSRELAGRIRESIVSSFYDAGRKTFGNGTHDSLALAFGVVKPSQRDAVAASLAKVYQENGRQFDGGFMSYEIYPQLTEFGNVDLALEMLRNPAYPGIAQSIRDYDATTIFERFRNDSRRAQVRHSLNHHAANHPTAWMLNYLAGIRCHPEEPGFRRLLLQPFIPKDLEWVKAEMETPYGVVKSSWKQETGRLSWRFVIPPSSVAELRPPRGIKVIQLDGRKTQVVDGKLDLPSGTYQAQWKQEPMLQEEEAASWNSRLRPPAGRLAIVVDGNSPDPDDIGATAVMFGLLNRSGLNSRLVHLSHSCDLRPTERISGKDERRRQKVLDEVCEQGLLHFGPFERLKCCFNCRKEREAAVADLRDAINASSPDSPLWIIEAGEPDVIGFALQRADPSKSRYVHIVSHHPANDDSGDFFEWPEILAFGIEEHQIGDQNTLLQTTKTPWDWARKQPDPGIAWIWDRLHYAEQDGVVEFQKNKFDCSDAGMLYWWITGAQSGGEKKATPDDFKQLLIRK
ncbi:Bacterial alpha-L-rhamnosidase [Pirellulimonas nuda]|uniref:alpha-L-rhamnosidase n=1 Tax=Pirellulimonas nuda TaxID=2528009 RepID=A0A518DBU6_9BACT|nr:alpha-L-rhamnosidase [Pirellulimonas nuda]QDU88933.1 Bacterial alpha-L-rhamnosidase [Pirellulimonas nuda]